MLVFCIFFAYATVQSQTVRLGANLKAVNKVWLTDLSGCFVQWTFKSDALYIWKSLKIDHLMTVHLIVLSALHCRQNCVLFNNLKLKKTWNDTHHNFKSLKFFFLCGLTKLWQAGPEEDWTAWGWCGPGDLETSRRKLGLQCKGQTQQRRSWNSVSVPVRWPLIILSWELKSCLYFSLDDWGTAQSVGGWMLQQNIKMGMTATLLLPKYISCSSSTQTVKSSLNMWHTFRPKKAPFATSYWTD